MRKRKKRVRKPKIHTQRNQTTVSNAEKIRTREYTIIRRELKGMSRNDIDAVENMPDEDPPTPTETILDPWEMAFCPCIRAKVCFHTIIFRLDHDTFYISLFFISEVILYVHLNPLHLHRCLLILRLHRDINWGMEVKMEAKFRRLSMKYVIQGQYSIISQI